MAIGANSYGTVAEVAALVGRYTDAGSFTASTRPTTTAVEKFIDRISGILNVVLAQMGFTVPITQADAKLMLDAFVVDHAVHLCHAANGAGPYGPGNDRLRGRDAFGVIMEEAARFIETHAAGLEHIGAARPRKLTYGLGIREEDDVGDELVHPFQRKQVGHNITDWDTDDE